MLTLYESYYKLSADPFRLSPDHRFSFGHRSYARAKAYLEYALHRGEGFITITGSAGTGKTTLISEILAELDKSRLKVATLNSTQLEGKDLLQMVAALFGLEYEDESKAALLLEIEEFLKQLSQKGRRAVLIVDEAQGLSPSAVEELRLLANLQFNHRLLLQVFLVGQEQLRDMVRAPGMEHLRQRIVAASHLEVLSLDETISYIEHRLTRVGWQGDPALNEDALRLVHRFSGGVPRRINLICSRLFLYGSMEQKHALDGADARSVIEDLQQELLISPEAVEEQADPEQGGDQNDGTEAPVRRLPRAKPAVRPQRASAATAGGAHREASSRDTGPGGVTEARAEASATQVDAEVEFALRERDIWGEIEHLEKELQGASEEMHSAEALDASELASRRSVAASGALGRQGAAHALQQDTVGAAVSKAVSRGRGARTSGQRSGEQQRAAAARVREARPRFQTVAESAADAGVEHEEILPLPRAERREAMRRSRHQAAAEPRGLSRRWSLLGAILMLGLGFAATIGWQNRDRLSSSEPDSTGTIRRDSLATQQSSGFETETSEQTVVAEAPNAEALSQSGEGVPAVPTGQAAGVEAGQPELYAETAPQGAAVSAPDHTVAGASGLPTPDGLLRDTAAASLTDDPGVKAGVASATNLARETDAASATPTQAPARSAELRTTATKATADPSVAAAEQAPDAADSLDSTPGSPDSIEAQRARLRREAEQRFNQQLARAEGQADKLDVRAATPVPKPADKLPVSKPVAAAPLPQNSKSSTAQQRAILTPAPKTAITAAPASRPKTTSIPKQVASAPVSVIAEPARSPEQLRKELLQAQWTSRGKPATLLPSEITFCSAAGTDINCWSIPQKTDTKYGKALYKVEASLDGFGADGRFRLSYRTLVKLLGSDEVADEAALGSAADDDTGWQVTERSMECELGQGDSVQCRGANGTVRDYRKGSSGKKLQ